MTNKTELIKRYIFLLVGLFVNGLGVSFITKAGLGTSQLQNLLQLPIIALFSFFIDLTMSLLGFIQPETYVLKVISLVIGCLILGFGVFMEMVANVAMLPGEATVRAVSDVFSTDFGKTKIAFDSSMTVIAAILSFIMFKHLDGVREGTIVAAILVGFIARLFKKYIGGIEKILIS